MNLTRNTLTGLFMIATFTMTFALLGFSEEVADLWTTAKESVQPTAHADNQTPSADSSLGDEGWEMDSADSPSEGGWSMDSSSTQTASSDGWSMDTAATGSPSGEGKAACCSTGETCSHDASSGTVDACCSNKASTQADAGSAGTGGDACCAPGGESAGAACASLGLFEVSKIAQYKAAGDWCTAHGVPESMCVKCNPALVAQFKEKGDWCAGHDLPESLCPLCHKELAEAGIGRDWCATHGVPASQCTACEMAATAERDGDASGEQGIEGSLDFSVGQALESFSTQAEPAVFVYDPVKRQGINPNCLNHLSKIKFDSVEIQERADLRNEPVRTQPVFKTLSCYGEVRYDENRYALISPLAGGVVKEVLVDLGDTVEEGDVLAIVDCVEFGKVKADYLRAAAEVQRWEWLNATYTEGQASGAVAKKELIEAQAELDSAKIELAIAAQALRNFGLDEERIAKIQEDKNTDTRLEISAPFKATLVARKAVTGENVDSGQPLFEIADLSTMWLFLSVFPDDLEELAPGMPVAFRPEGEKATAVQGKVTWISPTLDEKTRTATVRAELENPDNRLRRGLFGTGVIAVHEGEQMAVVPEEAIQWDGCCNMAFVQTQEGEYEPRKVRLGDPVENGYVVLAGLSVGEAVATQGSYLLKTEVLKSQIGAGCCGND